MCPALGIVVRVAPPNAIRHFAGNLGRRDGVLVADEHDRRHVDGAEVGPRVRPTDDRLLLAQVSLKPDGKAHPGVERLQCGVVSIVGMDRQREGGSNDLSKLPLPRQGHGRAATLGGLDACFAALELDHLPVSTKAVSAT